jgi:hypothetical protein
VFDAPAGHRRSAVGMGPANGQGDDNQCGQCSDGDGDDDDDGHRRRISISGHDREGRPGAVNALDCIVPILAHFGVSQIRAHVADWTVQSTNRIERGRTQRRSRRTIKCGDRPADGIGMEADSTPGSSEQVAVQLRSRYRCERCHKNCQVPCRFTGAEFRQLVRAVRAICDVESRHE